jgi:transcriptional regulator with XRE-family HTH domain
MADARRSPTVRRRRLARELRRLREQAGLTADQVTRRLEWAEGKVNRLEKAQTVRPRVTDIKVLLDLYGLEDETTREALFTLTREARQRGWWAAYGPLSDNYVEFEAEASAIHTFELAVVPGLLQTPRYTAALQRAWTSRDEAEVERLVGLRMERQKILTSEHPPLFRAVIDESAIVRSFGSAEAKVEQLRRLIDTGPLEHVNVQILPMSADPHLGLSGPFTILDYEDDPSVVYREVRPRSSLYVEGDAEVEERRQVFRLLSASALGVEESTDYLRRIIDRQR